MKRLLSLLLISSKIFSLPILKKEEVIINIPKNMFSKVNVRFEFAKTQNYESYLIFPENEAYEYKNFKVNWNKKNVSVEKITSITDQFYSINNQLYRTIYKYKIPFTELNNSTHEVSYYFNPSEWRYYKYLDIKGNYFEYIFNTGSLWNKNINYLKINIIFEKPICEKVILISKNYNGICYNEYNWQFEGKSIDITTDLKFVLKE